MRHLNVFQRFLLVIALLAVASGATLVAQVNSLRDAVVQERQSKVRDLVDAAKSILAAYDSKARAGQLPAGDARRLAFDTIGALRWGPYADYVGVYGAGPADAGITYVHPNPKYVGVNRWDYTDGQGKHLIQDIVAAARSGGGFVDYRVPRSTGGAELPKLAYVGSFASGDTQLAVQAGVYIDDIDDAVWRRTQWTVAGSLAAIALASLVAFAIGRGLTRPLVRVCGVMDRLAADDLDAEVPFVGLRNEIGRIAGSLNLFKAALVRARAVRADQDSERKRADADKQAALDALAQTIEADTGAALHAILQRTTAMTETADQMTGSAERTNEAARVAAGAAAQALANAQTVAGAAEELSASIAEIGSRMGDSARVVGRAVVAGNETRASIESLNQQVAKIGAVAAIINEIAARTNLLALNATIEAARAGDAGKGFAVVASEVKQLANQTARSTAEITGQLEQVRGATATSVEAVRRIEQTITEIDTIAGSIAAAVEQQGAATAEIARNIAASAGAATEMASRIEDVAAEAAGAGRHSGSVRENAASLGRAMQDLRHSLTRVVRTSKSAPERRAGVREPTDLACEVTIAGATLAGRMADLSEQGARVDVDSDRDWPTGTGGTLAFEGLRVPFVVRSCEGGRMGLRFELDAAMAALLRRVMQRVVPGRAA